MAQGEHHEAQAAEEGLVVGSDRSFGLVIATALAVIALLPLLRGGEPRAWAAGVGAGFLLLALVAPRRLHPLNVLWMRFGLVLNRIVSPVVMGLLYYLTVTPMGLVMRTLGKDPLRRKWDPGAASYWIERAPPGPPPESMRDQF